MPAVAAAHGGEAGGREATVRRMLAAAPHRGNQTALVTTPHATIGVVTSVPLADLASTVSDNDDAAAVVGRLDNLHELAHDLVRAGVRLPVVSAASVLLAGYRQWGAGFVEGLRGTCCGVIAHGPALLCFRDHFGQRPLFHSDDGAQLLVASEAKQVAAGRGQSPEPDLDVVERFLFGDFDDRSAIKGVLRVPRASTLVREGEGRITIGRYWHPDRLVGTATLDPDEAVEALSHVLDRAVRRCLDDSAGVLLSGGVDSPTIAGFAAPAQRASNGRRLVALTGVYPDYPAIDESRYATLVADALDLDLRTWEPRAGLLDDLPAWTALIDAPITSLSPPLVAEAYRFARSQGVVTVLNGEIEEYALELRHYMLDHLVWNRRWAGVAGQVRQMRQVGRSWPAVGRRLVSTVVSPRIAVAYARRRGRLIPVAPAWVDASRLNDLGLHADLANHPRDRWPLLQLSPLHGDGRTLDADEICAAACGVQVRRPFADTDLWEFALSLPGDVKFPATTPKALLRHVARGRVPDAILDRTDKTYFDDYAVARTDRDVLCSLLRSPDVRLGGIDYEALGRRLDGGELSPLDRTWAHNLASAHAFLAQS